MALLHGGAQIRPTKPEVLATYLADRPWASDGEIEVLGAYRLEDPDGEVGLETHLVRTSDGTVVQVPLTYRGAPLAGADPYLVATMEHSVLGPRWVYDGCGDPVHVAALAASVLAGGTQAELVRELPDGSSSVVDPSVRVRGTGHEAHPGSVGLVDVREEGDVTVVVTSVGDLLVRRVLDEAVPEGGPLLEGTWPGVEQPVPLVVLRPH
ncbi:CG0192-related protein [Aeromicrobium sp.]|uniref:CG0192-related protein n=1 Tax=Aeromicrobium sp. TaxID=1871063 RepID=UPI00403345FB